MSDQPGEQLEEEPQSERGPQGSRDTGSDGPSRRAGGPSRGDVGRGVRHLRSTAQEPGDDAPDLPSRG